MPILHWLTREQDARAAMHPSMKNTLNQAMDSRFRGDDVISARHVTFTLAVAVRPSFPRKRVAGIHFGQRIPKLELSKCRRDRYGVPPREERRLGRPPAGVVTEGRTIDSGEP